jgi:hypothetical protein
VGPMKQSEKAESEEDLVELPSDQKNEAIRKD